MEKNDSNVSQSFRKIIKSLRTGDYSNASSELNETLQLLQKELGARKFEPHRLQKLLISLETLFSMQKMQDWVAVADILEYEFSNIWKELMQN